jgi:hypothetical protein
MSKPTNPYTALLKECQEWARAVVNRCRREMWFYPDAQNQGKEWQIADTYQRVMAADQLGYDVMLEAKPDGLHVIYIKRIPSAPWSIAP